MTDEQIPPQIPEGWYPDPANAPGAVPMVRYWDGAQWTGYQQAMYAQQPAAQPGYGQPGYGQAGYVQAGGVPATASGATVMPALDAVGAAGAQRTNVPGWIALALTLVSLVLAVLVSASIIPGFVGSVPTAVFVGVLALAAIVFAIVALPRRTGRRSGVGLGVPSLILGIVLVIWMGIAAVTTAVFASPDVRSAIVEGQLVAIVEDQLSVDDASFDCDPVPVGATEVECVYSVGTERFPATVRLDNLLVVDVGFGFPE